MTVAAVYDRRYFIVLGKTGAHRAPPQSAGEVLLT